MYKVLITDRVHLNLLDGLRQKGIDVDYRPMITELEVSEIIHNYHGLVVNSKIQVTDHLMGKGKNLLFVGRLGSGLEVIDIPAAKKHKIKVFNSPEGNANAVAEHELGMLLSLSNNIITADTALRIKNWDRESFRGFELSGKTIGIIGLGHTGTAFATKFKGWHVHLLSYDKYKIKYTSNLRHVEKVPLETLVAQSDIISLHVPLTNETHHMVNAEFIASCKDSVIISNTSRGKVVDTHALIDALELGKIRGACLDVFENEKPHTFTDEDSRLYDRLYRMQNVVLTPHVAGWTKESLEKIAQVLLNKIIDVFNSNGKNKF